jgi:DNA polymerase (family 10)
VATTDEQNSQTQPRPPLVNGYVAMAFDELATLLELQGESPFKTRAYRIFADLLRELPESISAVLGRGQLEELPGVGKAIAAKVEQLARTGQIDALERVRSEVPPQLTELLRIGGLGPAKIRKLWQEAGVTSLEALREACRAGQVARVTGFSVKAQEKLLPLVEALLATSHHVLLSEGLAIAAQLLDDVSRAGAKVARTAGALRRGVEIVEEIVLVVAGLSPSEVAHAITSEAPPSEANARVGRYAIALEPHETWPAAALLASTAGRPGPHIRIRCVTEQGVAEAMLHETADVAHLDALTRRAASMGRSLHEVSAGAHDEDEIYTALGLPRTPPELREGGLVEVPDALLPARGVRGVFHVHTTWSDGTGSIVEMARAAQAAGFGYVGISDHSRAASYANGLDAARLAEQATAVEAARREVPEVVILHGIEVDVMADGSLDLPDDVLARLDFVVASLHTSFQLDEATQTRRILRAVSHPLVTILGHPTGRLLLGRPGYGFDVESVADAAAANGTFLEINASPSRLDLSPPLARRAAARGARFCINPDAHETRGFGDVALGVAQARRAGLRSDQILNSEDATSIVATLLARKAAARARLGLAD